MAETTPSTGSQRIAVAKAAIKERESDFYGIDEMAKEIGINVSSLRHIRLYGKKLTVAQYERVMHKLQTIPGTKPGRPINGVPTPKPARNSQEKAKKA